MPELPEVEVLRRSLEGGLVGRRIEATRVWDKRLRVPVPTSALRRTVGLTVTALRRRAKYLLIDLDGGETLVVHLGMSGRLTLGPAAAERDTHEHVRILLDGDKALRYRDPRRFGQIALLRTDRLAANRRFRSLGVEPFDATFAGDLLEERARGRRCPVKSFLMDSSVVVGVGNIYASEALYRAGVHPLRAVARISVARWHRLAEAVQAVLSAAIRQGGTTLNDFANGYGEQGYFQVSLCVYGRDGESCGRCEGTIRRVVQSGRSTFYCPSCQR